MSCLRRNHSFLVTNDFRLLTWHQGKEPTNQRNPFQDDQLSKIFAVLGVVDTHNWSDAQDLELYKKIPEVKLYVNHNTSIIALSTHEGWEPGIEAEIGSSGFDLLKKMLHYDPKRRVTAGQALNHDYFKEAPLPINK
jgi:cyclin-dependent kinase 8/11